jgi:hypothetical protein
MHVSIRQNIDLLEASTRPAKLETTPLPYAEKALDPVLSKERSTIIMNIWPKAMPNAITQAKAMLTLIVLVVFYTTSFFLNYKHPKVPIAPKALC